MISSRRIFLQRLGLGAGGLFLLSPQFQRALAADGRGLARSTPEAEGVASSGILAFLDAVAKSKHEIHSVMIVRHGRVIAEGWWAPYTAAGNHTLYSLSKSFTSTAVGLAVAEGKLKVDDKVVSFFVKELPDAVSENLAALRVKDLLSMATGNETEPTGAVTREEDWVRAFLLQPIAHKPGSVFMYNSAATYMCSAIVQKLTGQKIIDYLRPRLFEPLGIEGMTWEECPRGINTGGWGLSVPTEALAKFGQLYLQKGKWEGRQILPAAWVDEATSFKIQQPSPAKPSRPAEKNDWLQGYCYQFWRCTHGAFRGDGAFGQFMVVMPEKDAVVVITSESGNLQGELDLVWEHLLPAIKDTPLPLDTATHGQLKSVLANLALPLPKSAPVSPTAARISGKVFKLETNASGIQNVSFDFKDGTCTFTARTADAVHPIACGIEQWQRSETAFPEMPPRLAIRGRPPAGTKFKVAASGTWREESTFEMTWRFYESAHHETLTCRFSGDDLTVSFLSSIAKLSGKTDEPQHALRGKLSA
jgi:CubicO group peptidase (beta-lactamase class C family)